MDNSNEYVRLVQYAILQTAIVPSLLCDLFVFIYFTRHWRKTVATAPQNHVIICLLFVSYIQKTVDAPLILYFLRWGRVAKENDTFCAVWNMGDYSLECMSLHLLSWCCLERHLFVFHAPTMKRKWCLIVLHYIPLLIILTYPLIFYSSVISWLRLCSNSWNYSRILCGEACYLYVPFWGIFDWLFNVVSPISIIIFTNLLLLVRFTWQNIRQQRQKRMIIQLVSISSLYLLLLTPQVIVSALHRFPSRAFLRDIHYYDWEYISYYINQCLPFVIVGSLPKMQKDLKRGIRLLKEICCQRTRIHPS